MSILRYLQFDRTDDTFFRVNAGITFIYLFMCLFSYGWTPMQALYPAEVLGYESRAKGLAFLGLVRLHLLLSFNVPLADLLYR